MSVKVIVTGGTFDKRYNPVRGELCFSESVVPEMLDKLSLGPHQVQVIRPFLVDSLDISTEQRQKIVELCQSATEKRLVVTHGTDTMVETAKKIHDSVQDKTIVLTGAFIPAQVAFSDAELNLGFALGCVQSYPNGVYIAMNGQIFEANKVMKDKKLGVFRPTT